MREYLIPHLESLLKLRKDRRYRTGLLQGAVSFEVIDQDQWIILQSQVDAGWDEPNLPKCKTECICQPAKDNVEPKEKPPRQHGKFQDALEMIRDMGHDPPAGVDPAVWFRSGMIAMVRCADDALGPKKEGPTYKQNEARCRPS